MIARVAGRALIQRSQYRVRQVLRYAFSGQTAIAIPATFDRLLTDGARNRFRTLAHADQRHLIAVAATLSRAGAGDDLVTAGLLHDIGKAMPGVPARLHHRVAKVLLAWVVPDALVWIANHSKPPPLGAGLWTLARHARTGAEFVRDEGYSDRVQWLIAHHERRNLTSDPELCLLIAADEASAAPFAR